MSNMQACHQHTKNLNLIVKCKCALLKDQEAEMDRKSKLLLYKSTVHAV